ncbi:hypothetical protein V5799_006047 [Amblyomma americanum]|uniref:Uncharacterized protein n=1 Tax=Amblyomma americanum TaxID=6943 RepID=A0AAQ4DXI1_AMBAM
MQHESSEAGFATAESVSKNLSYSAIKLPVLSSCDSFYSAHSGSNDAITLMHFDELSKDSAGTAANANRYARSFMVTLQ